jgi:hypothetical protein
MPETVIFDESKKSKGRGKTPSKSTLILRNMKPGDAIRIRHDDVNCTVGQADVNPSCTLGMAIAGMNKKGREYQYYHEGNHVAVVRRLA